MADTLGVTVVGVSGVCCPSAAQPAIGTLAFAPLAHFAARPLGSTWSSGSLPT
ncbi:MAG: hypothetical protein ACK5SI_05870 [Planctomycetia bacterium]